MNDHDRLRLLSSCSGRGLIDIKGVIHMSTAPQNILSDRSLLVKWAVTIIIPLLVCLIPLNEMYTQTMRLYFVTTLFVIFLFAFETLPTLISALLLPALYLSLIHICAAGYR